MINKGVAICHYNRLEYLEKIVTKVIDTTSRNTRVVVCDDGSDPANIDFLYTDSEKEIKADFTTVGELCRKIGIPLIQGPNLGVAANKNRALWALQDCDFLCILEDDLMPTEKGWFELYEEASILSGIHHFCRVQDKMVHENMPEFSKFMIKSGLTPIYGPSPRGDLTFLTQKVIREVGAFNPEFYGAGYAHGEWTERVVNAGLVNHPLKYVDIKEARNKFIQIGDTEGGRWQEDEAIIQKQLSRNRNLLKKLQKTGYTFHPLVLT